MELQVLERWVHDGAIGLPAATRVTYLLGHDEARLSTGAVELGEHALCFELVQEGSPDALLRAPVGLRRDQQYLLRCDRVDFPPGGVAYLHTHRGPGIRVLLKGSIDIIANGETRAYGPLEAWFENGTDPVLAVASPRAASAFVRCMVLPIDCLGRSSIRYVRDEDAGKPKAQRYHVYVDEPLELPVYG
jgi:quercetin dioxygenase-like cupin family protein